MIGLDKRFKRVVIWGHPLGSHTHSYIHAGFYKAFKYLGYETHWLDHNSDVSGIDFSDTLFITEGQVDKGIPFVKDSYYLPDHEDLFLYFDSFEHLKDLSQRDDLIQNVKSRISDFYPGFKDEVLGKWKKLIED